MSSYDRISPPRTATDWPEQREIYARAPSPSARRGGADESTAYDEPYGRRERSPDESDRRGKRRRSPSPGMGRGGADTYIPSYHRDRSPPQYRDRRDFADRHDGRGFGGRDTHEPAFQGDRRGPSSRSNLKAPHDLPYLATFAYYRDWTREEDPRALDDKDKLEEAYKKYRSGFLHKHQRAFFDDVKSTAWCKEKYGFSDEEVAERKRLKARGREGHVEAFIKALESGEYDSISFQGKLTTHLSPGKREAKLEEEPKTEAEGATTDGKVEDDEAKVKQEDDATAKLEDDEAEEKVKSEDATMQEGAQEGIKAEGGNNETKQGDQAVPVETQEGAEISKGTGTGEDANGKTGDEPEAKKEDVDSVLVPGNSHALFIKSLSPDIARADLEAHCKQVEGFDYIALGEPNVTKRNHRIGWVVFKADANMEQAMEKLCESKINDFTLHMNLADKATYQRLRQTPAIMDSSERIQESLEQVKRIVARFEAEAENDTRGSQAIEKRLEEMKTEDDKMEDGDEEAAQAQTAKQEAAAQKTLDLYLQYLRSVHHTCYYCVSVHDFAEELTRKCVKHVRRHVNSTANAKRKENEAIWVKNFDEKAQLLVDRDSVDPLLYGGESQQEELTKVCKPEITVEDEGKFRCKACKKLFKAAPFVEKHILNKHPEIVGNKLEELQYFNNYVLDPGHAMPPVPEAPQYSNNPNHPSNALYGSMANTFGAFNQMFNPSFNPGYNMMGGYPNFGAMNPMFQPMSAGFNGFGNGGMYGGPPLSGDARMLGDRIGGRQGGYGMDGGRPGKRMRRDYGPTPGGPPPPPPKGARIDPRAGRLHAYTDLDGPPASGGGEDLDMLDY